MHYTFDTPNDIIIWDIGHQSYPHKILTGRKNDLHTLRKANGISGFTKRDESIYDHFGAGHCSTSISAALGFAVARDLNNEQHEVVAVIGDGSLSAGMAYEAMNNAGSSKTKMIIILNDNEMSIAPAVGAMTQYLTKLISSNRYLFIRNILKKIIKKFPPFVAKIIKKFERNIKDILSDSNFFEDLGFYYIGPVDGHNLNDMVEIFKNIKDDKTITRPIFVHVITEKGKGFAADHNCTEKFHAVTEFDILTGAPTPKIKSAPSYTECFASQLIKLAEKNDKIVAITAAMPSGTGLNKFKDIFPTRMFDVGIAEQHAVTFAAGLACQGYIPFVTIYSTFLQRAYDQIIHDVSIQNLPVIFAIDRAGYVGADGPTHGGTFDIAYLSTLPNFIIMVPSDEIELARMMLTATTIKTGPCAFRYPRGAATGQIIPENIETLLIGKANLIKEGTKVAIINLGTKLNEVLIAADILEKQNFSITIIDARFAKPIDKEMFKKTALTHSLLITVEEGNSGGFSSTILDFLTEENLLNETSFRSIKYPDYYMSQDTQENMNLTAGLHHKNIIKLISEYFQY